MSFLTAALMILTTGLVGDPPAIPDSIRETQLTLMIDHANKRVQLQSTVIAKSGDSLTLLTAAHGIGPADKGAQVRLKRGELWMAGRVERVERNPYYRPSPSGDIPGADNAVAQIRLDEGGTLDPATLRLAEISAWATPDRDGGAVVIQCLDQKGKGQVARGGNYSNPRWLEWGPAYRPIPGDSGSGVFVMRKKPDGTVAPVLIGAVVDRSESGGGASLLSLRDEWLRSAIESVKPSAGSSEPSKSSARPSPSRSK